MWLMTKHGFYSIVEKQAGEFQIRAREKHDLENLREIAQLDDAQIVETPSNDYACRLIVGKDETMRVLAALLPVPALALRLAFSRLADQVLLSSARVHPKRLEKAGFSFRYEKLESALRHALHR